nr:retrovirus-related Pol polyprotein from transposon TNT 1-94 [Tanacetum cinerariifolium]
DSTGSPSSTMVNQDAPSPSKSHTTAETQSSVIPQDDEEDNLDIEVAHIGNDSNLVYLFQKLLLLNLHQRGIFINQSKYALESLKKYGFESCDPVDTQMVEKSKPDEDKERKVVDLSHYCEAVATTCYTKNRSIIRLHHGKTPYELLHNKLPDLSFLHVFGALCYPNNDSENLGKLQPKADIGIFIAPVVIAPIADVIPSVQAESTEVTSAQSSSTVSPHTTVQPDHQIPQHNSKWTKDHPLDNNIGQLFRPVSTWLQLHEQALFCYYDAFLTSVEPKTYKDALTQLLDRSIARRAQ